RFASVHVLYPHKFEVVSVRNFPHELAAILAFLHFFLFSFLASLFRFVLALVDDLLDLLFFLGRFLGIERLVVFFDQPLHGRSIDFQNLVGLHLGGLGLSLALEFVLNLAIHVGVVVLALLVF